MKAKCNCQRCNETVKKSKKATRKTTKMDDLRGKEEVKLPMTATKEPPGNGMVSYLWTEGSGGVDPPLIARLVIGHLGNAGRPMDPHPQQSTSVMYMRIIRLVVVVVIVVVVVLTNFLMSIRAR